MFTDFDELEKERSLQRGTLEVRKKYGLNAVVKGMNLLDGATTIQRNMQIGGHRVGSSALEDGSPGMKKPSSAK